MAETPEQAKLRNVVARTRQQLADVEVASLLQQIFPVVPGFDLAQSIAWHVMKNEFLAQGGNAPNMPLFEAEIRKALVEM